MFAVIFSSPGREKMLQTLKDELKGIEIVILDSPATFGKQNFWRRWEQARQLCLNSAHDEYLILPDDICELNLKAIKAIFKKFKNKPFVCSVISDGRSSCWGSRPNLSNNRQIGEIHLKDVGFFDCGGITSRSTLQMFKVDQIPKTWFRHKGRSSGVGFQLTKKLAALKVPQYVTEPSLSTHGDHDSVMHPEERKNKPLIASSKKLPIVVGMATFKGREKALKKAIESLSGQVDKIILYDNEKNPDLTDNGKFYVFTQLSCPSYVFLCDDDLEYSQYYVKYTIEQIEKHKCIITHHGRILQGQNRSYYRGHNAIRCLDDSPHLKQLHVAGTGVTAFRSDYFLPVGLHRSTDQKMSDLVFSLEAAKQGKKIMTVPHKKGFVKQLEIDNYKSIHSTMRFNEQRQIEIANEICTIFNIK